MDFLPIIVLFTSWCLKQETLQIYRAKGLNLGCDYLRDDRKGKSKLNRKKPPTELSVEAWVTKAGKHEWLKQEKKHCQWVGNGVIFV